MARTTAEIKKIMTDKFLTDETLREAYNIPDGAVWENTFSTVSIENMLVYIIAFVAHTLETIYDQFKFEVDNRIAQNIVPTVRWYYTQALTFQYGDPLIYDESLMRFGYDKEDESKKIVKFCAVKDLGGSVQMLVSGMNAEGFPEVLSNNVLNAFKSYMNQVKIAGVILDVKSLEADRIEINATVQIDPQIINAQVVRISDGTYIVENAIDSYLRNIVYGGTFNKTKCVDAIQEVEGVLDVTLGDVKVKPSGSSVYTTMVNNNYTALSGCFRSNNLKGTINYVV